MPLANLLTIGLARFNAPDGGLVPVSGAIIVGAHRSKDREPRPWIDTFNFNAESVFTDAHYLFELAEYRQRCLAEVQRRLDRRRHLSSRFGWRARPGWRTAPSPQCWLRIANAQISRGVGRPIPEQDYVRDQRAWYFARLSRSLIHFCPHHLGENGFRRRKPPAVA